MKAIKMAIKIIKPIVIAAGAVIVAKAARQIMKMRNGRSRPFFIAANASVFPVKGSVVCCYLGMGTDFMDHSGVYVGDGKIVHRDGNGYLAIVPSEIFIKRLGGRNCASSIYVSCRGEYAVGSDETARKALEAVSDSRHCGYNLLKKNCHHFCQFCLTGEIAQWPFFPFTSLESILSKTYGFDNWREWKRA